MSVLKILYVADVHGSETYYRKFLNALKIYKADVGILMGDLCGKMINPIVAGPNDTYTCTVMGHNRTATGKDELEKMQKDIAQTGNYHFITSPDELDSLSSEGKTVEGRIDERSAKISLGEGRIDDLFRKLAVERMEHWMELGEERLAGSGIDVFVGAGNDDLFEIDAAVDKSSYFVNANEKRVMVKDYEMITLPWANPTPWQTERECSEEELTARIDRMAGELTDPATAIFNFHVPPHGTLLDQAPKLSANLVPSTDETISAGSTAVLESIQRYQPLLGLHGHIHESRGIVKVGKTTCINPGSEYSEGIFRGVLVMLKKNKVKDFMFVSG